MLNIEQRQITSDSTNLKQWAQKSLGLAGTQVRVRLRENNLYILWEGKNPPTQQKALERLKQALKETNLTDLLDAEQLLDRIYLYGRVVGEKLPNWTEQIELQEHQNQVEKSTSADQTGEAPQAHNRGNQKVDSPKEQQEPVSARVTEVAQGEYWREAAGRGNLSAIARYLGTKLSHLGVTVKVTAKTLPAKAKGRHQNPFDPSDLMPPKRRLWVFCESGYSPDQSLLAPPLAQQLRELNLSGFQDAVIVGQVIGEESPDWMQRVDLTPPSEMLQEWAQWGDEVAIERLLNRPDEHGMDITVVIKESTLHICCTTANRERIKQLHIGNYQTRPNLIPDKQAAIAILTPILQSLAPQGIKSAILYGHEHLDKTPVWVEWLGLPANTEPKLADPAVYLAGKGDEEALEFLLGQLLNPDMDWRLATGGIRIQVRRREDLLHVMTDALICPLQQQVAPPVAQFIEELGISGIAGLRIYGRRAGEKQPSWTYNKDFVSRNFVVPEGTPEFATTPEFTTSQPYLEEEIETESSESGLKSAAPITEEEAPDLLDELGNKIQESLNKFGQSCYATLTRSQICTPREIRENFRALPGKSSYQGAKVALVWGALGIMLTLSTDLIVGSLLKVKETPQKNPAVLTDANFRSRYENLTNDGEQTPEELTTETRSGKRKRRNKQNVFDTGGFTKPGNTEVKVDPKGETVTLTTKKDDFPNFNNPQLDEKLAIYQKQVEEKGPPDILIIGSSRAMRGIDPAVLQKALAEQGYGDIQIFNFGINGATAQIVDLVVRRLITPNQMPKLIIWADGARAINSGRPDLTYSKINESEGFKEVLAGTFPKADSLTEQPNKNLEPFTETPSVAEAAGNIWTFKAKDLDNWLNNSLGSLSASYEERERLNTALRDWFGNSVIHAEKPTQKQSDQEEEKEMERRPVNWDGFLPISLRFNPETYYNNHARVPGNYDTDYKDFYLGGLQNAAIESLIQYTQSQQIPLVFINLPLTKEYLDPARRQYEREFELYMLRLSLRSGFVFRNWNQLWPEKNEYFSDPSHLNRFGAVAVSRRLVQDPLIPWPKKGINSSQ